MNPNTVDERGFIADIQQRHGLITTKPSTHTHTWSNGRGSFSKIAFIMVSTPTVDLLSDVTPPLLGCDHRAVAISFRAVGPKEPKHPRATRPRNRFGGWCVNGAECCHGACDMITLSLGLTVSLTRTFHTCVHVRVEFVRECLVHATRAADSGITACKLSRGSSVL